MLTAARWTVVQGPGPGLIAIGTARRDAWIGPEACRPCEWSHVDAGSSCDSFGNVYCCNLCWCLNRWSGSALLCSVSLVITIDICRGGPGLSPDGDSEGPSALFLFRSQAAQWI